MDVERLAARGGICPYLAVEAREVVKHWVAKEGKAVEAVTEFIDVPRRGSCNYGRPMGGVYGVCNIAVCPLVKAKRKKRAMPRRKLGGKDGGPRERMHEGAK